MRHRFWSERLSPWIEGELDEGAARAVEAHVDECAACRRVVADLQELRRRAEALGASGPDVDLWPSIEAGLRDRPETRVIDFSDRLERAGPSINSAGRARRARDGASGGLRSGVPGWALGLAAGIALVAGWGLGAGSVPTDPGATAGPVLFSGPEDPALVRVRSQVVPPERARTLAELESRFRASADHLSPETVARLERNLATIDRAIGESLRALAEDPGNEFLRSHAGSGVERRERLLRSVLSMLEEAE